ncbi:MAG: TetR family transcriptional regulator [Alphaproteobacteria bacterium]|nr:TetR family transcriptional regulator [Alphaproteobacteria bacterium]
MARKADVSTRVIQAAMARAAAGGWHGLGLAAIATAARVPLAEVYEHFPSKTAILAAIMGRADAAVLAEGTAPGEEPARDRLFDVMMRRFDALGPYRKGLAAVARDLPRDPLTVLCLKPRLLRSMAWMLEVAGIGTGGIAGCLRVGGLAAIHADVMRTWLKDDSEDKAETMAALDRRLRQAERLIGLCRRFGARTAAPASGR